MRSRTRHSSDQGCSYRSGGTAATAWTKKSDAALNAATAGVSIVPFLAPRRAMWWIYGSNESRAANVADYGIRGGGAPSGLRVCVRDRRRAGRQALIGAVGPGGMGRFTGTAAMVHARWLAFRPPASTRPQGFTR